MREIKSTRRIYRWEWSENFTEDEASDRLNFLSEIEGWAEFPKRWGGGLHKYTIYGVFTIPTIFLAHVRY